ncbi:MAG: fibronectin type III domain-containing protein [Verrucomicrobia bacterium]|nr:fibronectin type III domain-containing protein [Verrucomicrobiota bacterium]
MKQNINNKEADLLELGIEAADGLDGLGVALEVTPDIGTGIRTAAANLTAARNGAQLGRGSLRNSQASVQAKMAAGRHFATLVRELLKPHVGNGYSQAWDVVGFVGTLAMPGSTAKMQLLLSTIKTFLTDNPTRENGPLLVTAAQADLLHTQLQAAVTTLNAQQTTAAGLRLARKDNRNLLRLRLWALVAILKSKMGALDDRWVTFGFNKPGAQEKPAVPVGLTAVLIGETSVSFKWPPAARADQYRIWARVVGVDAVLGSVALRGDLDFTLEQLPRNSVVEVALSALNNGGESAKSTILTVTTL